MQSSGRTKKNEGCAAAASAAAADMQRYNNRKYDANKVNKFLLQQRKIGGMQLSVKRGRRERKMVWSRRCVVHYIFQCFHSIYLVTSDFMCDALCVMPTFSLLPFAFQCQSISLSLHLLASFFSLFLSFVRSNVASDVSNPCY